MSVKSTSNQSLPPIPLSCLLVTTGLIVIPHAINIPIQLFTFFIILLAWRLTAVWKQWPLPNKWGLLALSILGMVLISYQFQGILGRDAGTNLLVVGLGLKLLETRTPRDFYFVVFICFYVASTQFLYFDSIFMSLYILLISCSLIASLISFNCIQPDLYFAFKFASKLVLQAMPLMVIIFAVFPRIEAPRWLFYIDDNAALSGLSDSLEPGSISSLGKSDKLAFRAKFEGKVPPPEQRYWRGPVFDHTDGKRWSQGVWLNQEKNPQSQPSQPEFSGTAYTYTILLESQKFNWVYALDLPSSFPSTIIQRRNYQLISKNKKSEKKEFRLTSYSAYKTLANEAELPANLQLPAPPSTKINNFLSQLRQPNKAPQYLIDQLLQYFHDNEFYYTLNPPLYPDTPIESFLFEARQGFCSHYATAFVYLMRAAKIPARVVGGYQGGEYNEVGQFIEVKQAHAHAWTEVWLDNQGWVRVDPTAAVAPERITQDINVASQIASGEVSYIPINIKASNLASWLKKSRFIWSNIEYSWQHWVIHYSTTSRAGFLTSLGIDDIKNLALWLSVIITSILLILAWFILPRKTRNTDKVAEIYQRFIKKVKQSKLPTIIGEGPLDFAQRIKALHPALVDDIDQITNLYIKLRYRNNANEHDLVKLKRNISRFKIN